MKSRFNFLRISFKKSSPVPKDSGPVLLGSLCKAHLLLLPPPQPQSEPAPCLLVRAFLQCQGTIITNALIRSAQEFDRFVMMETRWRKVGWTASPWVDTLLAAGPDPGERIPGL